MTLKGTGDYKHIFTASYARVLGEDSRQRFFDAFYDKFLASSPVVAEKFSHTDLQRQKRMLQKSLVHVTNLYSDLKVPEELSYVAALHSHSQKDIQPHLYDFWLDSLIDTVREHDPEFSSDVELAWRMALAAGIAYMKFRYDI